MARALAVMLLALAWAGRATADPVDDLARTATADPSEKARIAAVLALGKLADPRGEPALERALHDRSSIVREVAASALRHVRAHPRVRVTVKSISAPRHLTGRMRDLVVAQLAADRGVSVEPAGGFIVDGSITRLARAVRGPWVEVTCEIKLTVSNSRGSLLSIVSGGATVQTARGAFRHGMEPALQAEALENAVRGAHGNLLTFLQRQAAAP